MLQTAHQSAPPLRSLSLASPRLLTGLALLLIGCSSDDDVPVAETVTAAPAPATTAATTSEPASASASSESAEDVPQFKPLNLTALQGRASDDGTPGKGSAGSGEQQIQAVIRQLQPLQVLLGQWRGTTRREFESFKAVDSHEWVWDLRTDPAQPALTLNSDKSPYLRNGRLTWDTQLQKFLLTAVDGDGKERRFSGEFTEAPHEITGSDDKLHRVYRLELNEETTDAQEAWQVAFVQQENNRYLLEVARRRGKAAYARWDTVSTQREGTSFALSDTDYAEKTCIISEGLGTTEIVFKGRSYWVCCSGCKAAFEEDPEKWIARAAVRSKDKK
ncbi:MAG: hypothetical protein ACKO2L_12805 [Planctomycetaceae bacterium]